MAYTLDFSIALGSGQTGLTLEAILVDTTGANVGAAITTGFVEISGGDYLWHATAIPDGHRGGVKFQVSPGGAHKAFAAINPEEGETVRTVAEPGQGVPPASASIAEKIAYLYKAWKNRTTQTATQYSLYNDDATTVDQKAVTSDDNVTTDRGEVGSGP